VAAVTNWWRSRRPFRAQDGSSHELFFQGERGAARLMIASAPEGDDKPLKYPGMFADADVVVLNKIDLLAYVNFNEEKFYPRLKALNPDAVVFPVSCKTGVGLQEWLKWLEDALKRKQNK
jgi:hydrogenase nickel incorporation protein HypB